jgi:hypothetical protein
MKRTMKLAVFFLLLFSSAMGLKAQDKYDYAEVKFLRPGAAVASLAGIYVSISGKESEKIEVKKEQVKNNFDDTPVLNYVQNMTNSGWRVMNTIIEGGMICFILEKKKN